GTVGLMRSSLSNASRASTSSRRRSKFSALRTLGLFRRMIPTGGSVSTTIWLNGKRDQSCGSELVYKALGIFRGLSCRILGSGPCCIFFGSVRLGGRVSQHLY